MGPKTRNVIAFLIGFLSSLIGIPAYQAMSTDTPLYKSDVNHTTDTPPSKVGN